MTEDTMQSRIDRNEAPNGRTYSVVQEPLYGFWYIKPDQIGPLPDSLDGRFTTEWRAEQHLVATLTSMWNHANKLTRKRELREHKESVASG